MDHIKNLEQVVGDFKGKKILDVGAGWGGFLIEGVSQGYDITGLEIDKVKIEGAHREATRLGLKINLVEGVAEDLPFMNGSFDFINVGEVIEHVRNPKEVLKEIYRVLNPGGNVYVSVHNRFGIYDTHFHVYFLGWMPRVWANNYLALFKKHKDYINAIDFQNIQEMHYFTFRGVREITEDLGFKIIDIREEKIKQRFNAFLSYILLLIYINIARPFYFSTFHVLLIKI